MLQDGKLSYLSENSIWYSYKNGNNTHINSPVNLYPKTFGNALNPSIQGCSGFSHIKVGTIDKNQPLYSAIIDGVSSGSIEDGIGFLTNGRVIGSYFKTPNGAYGLTVYAHGKVAKTGTLSTTFSSLGTISVTKSATGTYDVKYPNSVPAFMNTVITQGVGSPSTNKTKTTLGSYNSSGFTVYTADDDTVEDGAFEFMVVGFGSN